MSWDTQRQERTLIVVLKVSGYKTQKGKADNNRAVGLFGIWATKGAKEETRGRRGRQLRIKIAVEITNGRCIKELGEIIADAAEAMQ